MPTRSDRDSKDNAQRLESQVVISIQLNFATADTYMENCLGESIEMVTNIDCRHDNHHAVSIMKQWR